MRETTLNKRTIKLLTEGQTAFLLTIISCYLLMPLLNIDPVVRTHAISVANLMSKATALCMGRSVINVRVLIISTLFVVQRLQQPRQNPALTGRSSLSHQPGGHPWAATVAMAKEEAGSSQRRRRCPSSHQSRKHMRLHSRTETQSHQEWHLVGEMVMYYKTWSFQDQRKKVHTTGFLVCS